MTWGTLSWLLLALMGLWTFGAYNRLMRERAAATRAFGQTASAIEARAEVLLAMSHAQLLHTAEPALQALWHRMEACVQQAANTAAHASVRPLDPVRMAALSAGLAALDASVQDAQRKTQGQFNAPWPVEIQSQLARCDARLLTQSEAFGAAVALYNESIGQFPTLLVAKLFGFGPAMALQRNTPTL
jgi:LemA protein